MGAGDFHDAICQLRKVIEVATPSSTDKLRPTLEAEDVLNRFLESVATGSARPAVRNVVRRWLEFLTERCTRPEAARASDIGAWRASLSQQGGNAELSRDLQRQREALLQVAGG